MNMYFFILSKSPSLTD